MWKCVKTQEGSRESTGGEFGLLGHHYSYCATVSKFSHIVLCVFLLMQCLSKLLLTVELLRSLGLSAIYDLFCTRVNCSDVCLNKMKLHNVWNSVLSCRLLNNLAWGPRALWESGLPHMDRTSHAIWPQAKKKKREINISSQASETLRTCLTPWQHAVERRLPCKPIGSLQSPTLPGDKSSQAPTYALLSGPCSPSARGPRPSPCNLSLPSLCCSNSTAVSIVNGYCYEWGPLLLFFSLASPGQADG